MATIDLIRNDLKYTFGFEPITRGGLEFHLKEALEKERRLLGVLLCMIAAIGFGLWIATGSNAASVLLLIAVFVVMRFATVRSEIKRCSDLVLIDDLPSWLLSSSDADKELRNRIVILGRRQGGLFRWQISAFKSWRYDQQKQTLKQEIAGNAMANTAV